MIELTCKRVTDSVIASLLYDELSKTKMVHLSFSDSNGFNYHTTDLKLHGVLNIPLFELVKLVDGWNDFDLDRVVTEQFAAYDGVPTEEYLRKKEDDIVEKQLGTRIVDQRSCKELSSK